MRRGTWGWDGILRGRGEGGVGDRDSSGGVGQGVVGGAGGGGG